MSDCPLYFIFEQVFSIYVYYAVEVIQTGMNEI